MKQKSNLNQQVFFGPLVTLATWGPLWSDVCIYQEEVCMYKVKIVIFLAK